LHSLPHAVGRDAYKRCTDNTPRVRLDRRDDAQGTAKQDGASVIIIQPFGWTAFPVHWEIEPKPDA
jgi:hypothetical protein